MRGLARGLPADGKAWAVQLLRSLHSHRRLDVQPTRQVAQGHRGAGVAAQNRIAELPIEFACLAPGSQWIHASGSWIFGPRRQQESRDRARVPAARCQLSFIGGGSLPAQPSLRERRGRGKASRAAVAVDGCRDRSLQRGHRHLAMGQQRSGQRARRGDGVRRGCADPGNFGGGFHPSAGVARFKGAGRQCGRPHEAAAAIGTSAWPERQRFRCVIHQGQARDFRIPWISLADSSSDLPPPQSRGPACARLQGRRHDYHGI